MASLEAQSGILECGLPYARIGAGERPLVVFDGFRVEHRPAEGLVLQGMLGAYERYAEAGFTVYLIERRPEMPIDYSFDDICGDYIAALSEVAGPERAGAGGAGVPRGAPDVDAGRGREGVDLLGIGAGGLFALGVAARLGAGREHEEGPPAARRLQVAHLAVVSAAHRMSEAAREDAAGWIADAQKLRWRSVHAAMVRRSYAGGQALFYASLAWLFPDLLGTTDYPWDYIITVREAAATELADRLDGINVPTLILGGERDGMFSPADMEEAARRIPGAELGLIPGAGHAIAKSHRREVEGRVTSFLKQ